MGKNCVTTLTLEISDQTPLALWMINYLYRIISRNESKVRVFGQFLLLLITYRHMLSCTLFKHRITILLYYQSLRPTFLHNITFNLTCVKVSKFGGLTTPAFSHSPKKTATEKKCSRCQ